MAATDAPLSVFWFFAAWALEAAGQKRKGAVLAGVAYEYIRWTARLEHVGWAKLLLAPNLALQRLTTREPANDMVEVAIAAFEAMRRADAAGTSASLS